MYKVILVDDERIIREGIAQIITWEEHGFEFVGAAANAFEALDIIKEEEPDILITDIKMPMMDGLQLIEKAREQNTQLISVVLSGYGEFDFASQAMRLGVRHYLLKPCNEQDILKVLAEIKQDLDKRVRMTRYLKENNEKMEKMMPLVREQFLRDFIIHSNHSKYESAYYKKLLHLDDDCIRLVIFQIEQNFAVEELYVLSKAVEDAYQEDLFFKTIINHQILVASAGADSELNLQRINQVKFDFDQYSSIPVSVAYSDCRPLDAANEQYMILQDCLRYTFLVGEGSIITQKDLAMLKNEQISEIFHFDYSQITFAVQSGNKAAFKACIDAYFQTLQDNKCSPNLLRLHYLELLLAVIRGGQKNELNLYMEQLADTQARRDLPDMRDRIEQIGVQMTEANHDAMVNRQNAVVQQIIQYVQLHIDNEALSLKWIAEHILYMNEGYLSKLFIKETGEKFSAYITNIRVEKAKKIIRSQPDIKIYDVASQTGFGHNPQYFSQVFKKITGLTPSEFSSRS